MEFRDPMIREFEQWIRRRGGHQVAVIPISANEPEFDLRQRLQAAFFAGYAAGESNPKARSAYLKNLG